MLKNNNIDFFKLSIEQEKLITLDFKYLSEHIEGWWNNLNSPTSLQLAKFELANLILKKAHPGFKFYLDFRIDTEAGERMIPINPDDRNLIEKMRLAITACRKEKSISHTGTFTIVANFKVLHARAEMHIDRDLAIEIANTKDYSLAPRLLFRNKGQDARITNI